jgi:hypothetical protein
MQPATTSTTTPRMTYSVVVSPPLLDALEEEEVKWIGSVVLDPWIVAVPEAGDPVNPETLEIENA